MVVSVTSALASTPSNLVPSVATSLPSTVPVVVILPATFKAASKLNLVFA